MREIKVPDDYHAHIGFVVWSREGCASCPAVKRMVDEMATERGIPCVVADAEQPNLQTLVMAMGFRTVPVTQAVVQGQVVKQYIGQVRPSDIDAAVKEMRKTMEAAR